MTVPSQFELSALPVGSILDIGGSRVAQSLVKLLEKRLLHGNKDEQSLLPSALLSDDQGHALWKQINRLPHYYQTCDEIDLLSEHGEEIAREIAPGTAIIDLGAGEVRKVVPLLDQLELEQKTVSYFALDLSYDIMEEGITNLSTKYKHVRCFGLWGTLDDGLAWLNNIESPRWLLSLGSILGNDFLGPSIQHLIRWKNLMRAKDRFLLGMDGNLDKDKVWRSYHDESALFEQFMRNGLSHSNLVLGHAWYRPEDWDVLGVFSDEPLMHRFVFRANKDVRCAELGIDFARGHEIDCYEGFKYSPSTMRHQFSAAGFDHLAMWKSPSSDIYEYLLAKDMSQSTRSEL